VYDEVLLEDVSEIFSLVSIKHFLHQNNPFRQTRWPTGTVTRFIQDSLMNRKQNTVESTFVYL